MGIHAGDDGYSSELGLNDDVVRGLEKKTGDKRFA